MGTRAACSKCGAERLVLPNLDGVLECEKCRSAAPAELLESGAERRRLTWKGWRWIRWLVIFGPGMGAASGQVLICMAPLLKPDHIALLVLSFTLASWPIALLVSRRAVNRLRPARPDWLTENQWRGYGAMIVIGSTVFAGICTVSIVGLLILIAGLGGAPMS